MILASEYFRTARERYRIHIKRAVQQPKPWTDDKPFQQWRFCNVHREDDKVTKWFRDNVRSKLSGLNVIKATVAFRWFNRIETGELIKDHLLNPDKWVGEDVARILADVHPVVTGAYIINGMPGYDKLHGVLICIDNAFDKIDAFWPQWEEAIRLKDDLNGEEHITLEMVWDDLRTINYLGGFMSYEVVSDLRWTDVLANAEDINTWANAGPGCARGLGWTIAGDSSVFNAGSTAGQAVMLGHMRELLEMSRDPQYWPVNWPVWEMREVEHWACEFDKYQRAARGDRMKRSFKGA
jgi:hypothetical protein